MLQKKHWLVDGAVMVVGCILAAAGIACFNVPNNIAPGGISGLATVIAHFSGGPIGAIALGLNAPLFLLAWRVFGFKPLLKTGLATILLSVFIDAASLLGFTYVGNPLLAAMLGGALMGAGLGLLLTRGISTGGTDLISLILRKRWPQLSMGKLMMALDGAVVAVAVLVFKDIEVALYSTVTIFCASKVIDAVLQGVDYAKVIYIVTDHGAQISGALVRDYNRGVTDISVKGGYSGNQKSMLMTVARRGEVNETLRVIKGIDPAAFVVFMNATEVRGEGFKEMDV